MTLTLVTGMRMDQYLSPCQTWIKSIKGYAKTYIVKTWTQIFNIKILCDLDLKVLYWEGKIPHKIFDQYLLSNETWIKSIKGYTTTGPRQANLVLIAYASSEGSGEPAHPRSLARTSAAHSYRQWVKRNLQTESQIPGPSEWLGMRS